MPSAYQPSSYRKAAAREKEERLEKRLLANRALTNKQLLAQGYQYSLIAKVRKKLDIPPPSGSYLGRRSFDHIVDSPSQSAGYKLLGGK